MVQPKSSWSRYGLCGTVRNMSHILSGGAKFIASTCWHASAKSA